MLPFSTLENIFNFLGIENYNQIQEDCPVWCSANKFIFLFLQDSICEQYGNEHNDLRTSFDFFDLIKIRQIIGRYNFSMNPIDDLIDTIEQTYTLSQTEKNIIRKYHGYCNDFHESQDLFNRVEFRVLYRIVETDETYETDEREEENNQNLFASRLTDLRYIENDLNFLFMMAALEKHIRVKFDILN